MHEHSDGEVQILWTDMMTLVAGIFIVIVVTLIAHISDQTAKSQEVTPNPLESVTVDLFWDDNVDADMDLWVQGPDGTPVGYSNKGGVLFNLERDDLGNIVDVSGRNFETARTRGIVPGLYIVNVHEYRNRSDTQEIKCRVVVTVRNKVGLAKQILKQDLIMDTLGEERTVFQFKLDKDGILGKASITTLQTYIRSGGK